MSHSSPRRADRVAQLLHRELSAMVVVGLRDPRIGLVTLTGVKVTDDLKQAYVHVSVLGDEAARNNSLQGLKAAASFLKREVTARLGLRFAPDLRFVYDDSLVRAQRLEELLGAAERGEHEPPPTATDTTPPVHLDRSPPPEAMPPLRRPARPQGRKTNRRRKIQRGS